jgi:hypothetical protein
MGICDLERIMASDRISGSVLESAASRLASWMMDNRARFRISHVADPIRQLMLLKPLAEYALCNELLLSYGSTSEHYVDNLNWIWNEIERGDLLKRLLLARPDAFCVASLYAPLRRAGFCSPYLDIILHEVAKLRGNRAAEMQAWMRLGFLHSMAQIQETTYDPHSAGLTWLLGLPEPWCINDDILYSVTHEVFYASDFGRSSCLLPPNVIRYLTLWLPSWARIYTDSGNCDLLSEISVVADCLREVHWDSDPLEVVLDKLTSAGSVEGPPGAGNLLSRGSDTREQQHFYSVYHSTLVAAIAIGIRMYRRSYRMTDSYSA